MDTNIFSPIYSGTPLGLFSPAHLLALAVVLASCVLLAWALAPQRLSPRWREAARATLAGFALLNIIAWYIWEWHAGISAWSFSLPLQICTSALILSPFMLWFRSYRLFELCYFWGFAGATQALLTPDIAPYNFPHFVAIQFFTSHASILLCVVFMLVAEGYRPYWSSLGRAIVLTLAWLGVAGVANALTGGNYMYVAHKPAVPTLLDYLGPWPWYILALLAIGSGMMLLVYLPFAIRDWLVRRNRPFEGAPHEGSAANS